ncbi:MAG: hypothetical protein P4L53_00575 [Candidatus Obscuribacterales bacterium]|nr:hypothetical protein [Candidatus Obscuribacterales bacterium]
MMTESNKPLLRSGVEVARHLVPGNVYNNNKPVPVIVYTPNAKTSESFPGLFHMRENARSMRNISLSKKCQLNCIFIKALPTDLTWSLKHDTPRTSSGIEIRPCVELSAEAR